jgi:sortase A
MKRRVAFGALILGALLIAGGLYVPAKAAVAQILLQRAWERVLAGDAAAKPWPWADIVPENELEFPRLGHRMIVLASASGQAMAFGPGHMPNTPEIGAAGTAVIAAHRDTQFSFLGELKPGEVIVAVNRHGARMEFRVTASQIVRADASGIDPGDAGRSGSRLALVTCYPFSGVLHSPWRYVVFADRVKDARAG